MNKTHYIRIKLAVLGLLLLSSLVAMPAFALKYLPPVSGKIMRVKDGDTVVVAPEDGGQFFTCRLYGIDAPETSHGRKPGQPYGEESAKELKKLILGQTVDVTLTGQKTYKREVCMISKDGMNVNLEMVRRGFAWAYRHYLRRPYASEYIDAENEARDKKLGLWQDNNPTPPWEFRKGQKGKRRGW